MQGLAFFPTDAQEQVCGKYLQVFGYSLSFRGSGVRMVPLQQLFIFLHFK